MFPPPSGGVGQDDAPDPFCVAEVEQVRVRRRDLTVEPARHLGDDTIRLTHRAPGPVVVLRPEEPCAKAIDGLDGHRVEEAELGEVERNVLDRPALDPDELVDHLRHPGARETGALQES